MLGMGKTILIAEDDKLVLKGLANYFAGAGFTVYTAQTCLETVDLIYRHAPDCFLLDYHLADDTAQLACLSIRSYERTRNAPIVIYSGDDTRGAFFYESCQADAFVLKGRGYEEPLSAVRRHLRRAELAKGILRRDDLQLEINRMAVVFDDGLSIKLSPEQFRFFAVLLERTPRFVGEETLCQRVFATAVPPLPGKALNMLAYRLRKKLGPRYGRRIKSVKAYGWIYLQPHCTLAAPPAEKSALH